MKSKEIELKPGEGNYYRAMSFHWATVTVLIVPVVISLIIAIINPFWFRDGMFRFIETQVNKLSRWRNYTQYRIYLGCDPKVWHTLKGDLQ
jgi:hypothetical protein